MNDQALHINQSDRSADAGMMNVLEGMGQFVQGVKMMFGRSVEEKEQLRQQAEANRIEPKNIVAEGRQKKLIAILNAIFEDGYTEGVSKKDFMQLMSNAFGCPGLANYSQALYGIKNTYGYDDIFTRLAQVAHEEILKND